MILAVFAVPQYIKVVGSSEQQLNKRRNIYIYTCMNVKKIAIVSAGLESGEAI